MSLPDTFEVKVLAFINDAVIGIDNDLRVTCVNPAAERLYGVTAHEIIGHPLTEMVTYLWLKPGDEQRAWSQLEQGLSWRGENLHRRRDGTEMVVEAVVSPLRDAQGQRSGLVAVIRDVTAQHARADELERRVAARTADLTLLNAALQESESLYRSLVELAPDGIGVGVNDQVALLNRAGAQMLGVPSGAELVGQTVWRFVPPASVTQFQQLVEQVMTRREPVPPVELRLTRMDGRPLDVELSAMPVSYQRQAAYLVVFRDITERKLTEQALREGEERYRKLFENAPDAVFIVDAARLRVEDCNQSATKIFGFPTTELLGMRLDKLAAEPAKARREWQSFAEGTTAACQMPVSHFVREDGTTFPGELFRTTYEAWGRRKLLVVVRDVSERQRLERAVLEIGEQQQRRIGQDLHDSLCQHLLGISLMSKTLQQRLRQKAPVEAKRAQQITVLVNAAVAEVRGVARGMNPVKLEANGLMSALHELAAHAEQVYGVTCRFACAQPVHFTDNNTAVHLFRIAQEAVSNAMKHAGARRVTVNLRREPGSVVLTVTDDGRGLPKRPARSKGMGIETMHYRAGAIGAELRLERAGKRGTQVACVWPQIETK